MAGAEPLRGVVRGEGDDDRPAVSQMALGRHCHRRVRDARGELGEGVAGAGRYDEGVEEPLGPHALRGRDAVDDRAARQASSRALKPAASPKRLSVREAVSLIRAVSSYSSASASAAASTLSYVQ